MFKVILIVLLALVVCATSISCKQRNAQSTVVTPSPTPASPQPVTLPTPNVVIGKPYPGVGVVKLINLKEGWIEINHEDIPDLMPAMEMEWFVKDRSLLRKVKVGDKVKFTVVETGKGEILTTLEKFDK